MYVVLFITFWITLSGAIMPPQYWHFSFHFISFFFMNISPIAFEGKFSCYCYAIKVKCRTLDKKNLFRHSKNSLFFISNKSWFKFFINYYHIMTLPVDLIPQSMNLNWLEFLQKKIFFSIKFFRNFPLRASFYFFFWGNFLFYSPTIISRNYTITTKK